MVEAEKLESKLSYVKPEMEKVSVDEAVQKFNGSETAVKNLLATLAETTCERNKTGRENEELIVDLEQAKQTNAKLEQLVITDPLTGVYNRRGYEIIIEKEKRIVDRDSKPLGI